MNFEKQKAILKTHIPETLKDEDFFIAGGALTSVFTKSEINDIDIYVKSKTKAEDVIHKLTENWDRYFIKHVTHKAVTLVRGESRVQVIIYNFFQTPQEIFNDFDFSVNMAAYDNLQDNIIVSDNFLTSLASKEIEFNKGTKYPIASLNRTKKYIERGYNIPTKSLLQIGMSVSKLNINSWEELESQLGGIYGELQLDQKTREEPFNLDYAIDNIDKLFIIKVNMDEMLTREIYEKITGLSGVDTNLPSSENPWLIPF